MAVVGVATTAGLWLLGVPFALALGVVAFVLDFVPYIGPILSAVPAILVAMTLGPMEALYVGLLYFGVQSLESYLLTPLVQQRAVQLPPALTILSQVLLGLLLGGFGLALATPLTAVGVVLVRELYVEDVLEDRV
jgi:predicted PurR-regulated permease PerM